MEVKGDDGELSLHSSYSSVVVNTRTYLDALSWEMELPKMDSFVPWKRVLRTLSNGDKVGAWSYRTTDIVGEYKQAALLETKAESMGEDNEFYALVWNPKSVHGRSNLVMSVYPQRTMEFNFFRINVEGWSRVGNDLYVNEGMRMYDDEGNPYQVDTYMRASSHSCQMQSFATECVFANEAEADNYVRMLQWYIEMLKGNTPASDLKHDPWECHIPNFSEEGGFDLRLDAPLYLSFNSDIYQEFNVESATYLRPFDDGTYAHRGYDLGWREHLDAIARENIEKSMGFMREFTDKLTEVHIPFSM